MGGEEGKHEVEYEIKVTGSDSPYLVFRTTLIFTTGEQEQTRVPRSQKQFVFLCLKHVNSDPAAAVGLWQDGAPPLGWFQTAAYLVLPVLLVASQFASMQIMSPPSDVTLILLPSLTSPPCSHHACQAVGGSG